MRVMRVFDIEKDYLRHKKRLLSIQSLDPRHKLVHSTLPHQQAADLYRHIKVSAEMHSDRERHLRLARQNLKLHCNLTRVYTRTPLLSDNTSSKASLSSTNSRHLFIDNSQHRRKIEEVKSTYSSFRQTKRTSRVSSQNQVIALLEKQLGIKPKVVFPKLKRKPEGSAVWID